MRICVLASGSKGNCTYIESENSRILVDAGLSRKEIEKRLSLLNVSPTQIDAIFVTHEHSDHIKGLEQFSKQYNTKVYAHKNSWAMLEEKASGILLSNQIEFCGNDFNFRDFSIQTFDLDHDSAHCVGFSFIEGNKRFSTATDLGHMTDAIAKKLGESDFIVLESNHDVQTLLNNKNYPFKLKERILSNYGHISNDECAQTILKNLGKTTRGIILAHLSEQNNSPELAINTLNKKLVSNGVTKDNFNIKVYVAEQNRPSKIFRIKD